MLLLTVLTQLVKLYLSQLNNNNKIKRLHLHNFHRQYKVGVCCCSLFTRYYYLWGLLIPYFPIL